MIVSRFIIVFVFENISALRAMFRFSKFAKNLLLIGDEELKSANDVGRVKIMMMTTMIMMMMMLVMAGVKIMQQALHSSISVGKTKIWALAIFFGASG